MPPPRYKSKKSRSFKSGIFLCKSTCLLTSYTLPISTPAKKSFVLYMQRTYIGFNRTLSPSSSTKPLRRASSNPRESEAVTLSPNRV